MARRVTRDRVPERKEIILWTHADKTRHDPPGIIPPLVAFVSSVSSRVSSRHSRGAPGHWRNFLTMRSHLRRITPFSSGAVRHEYCIRMERGGGSEGQGRVPDPREWKNGEAGGLPRG